MLIHFRGWSLTIYSINPGGTCSQGLAASFNLFHIVLERSFPWFSHTVTDSQGLHSMVSHISGAQGVLAKEVAVGELPEQGQGKDQKHTSAVFQPGFQGCPNLQK